MPDQQTILHPKRRPVRINLRVSGARNPQDFRIEVIPQTG
jgi:hypothetical protein